MVLPLNHRVIYALVDPRNGIVRYVGITDHPSKRYRDHLKTNDNAEIYKWVAELKILKLKPMFVFIDSDEAAKATVKEIEWINHFQRLSPLINIKKK